MPTEGEGTGGGVVSGVQVDTVCSVDWERMVEKREGGWREKDGEMKERGEREEKEEEQDQQTTVWTLCVLLSYPYPF